MLPTLKRVARRLLKHSGKPESGGPESSLADPRPTEILRALMCLRDSLTASASDEYVFLDYCRQNAHLSKAQIFQDLFVLLQTAEKRAGFFVEFGAGNGVDLSNTHLLEKQFGWSGILAEPAQCWHEALRNGRGCAIDLRCVWNQSADHIEFNEVAEPEYSTIAQYSSTDSHSSIRETGRRYLVETVTLNDLLKQNRAPKHIDFLSIDTEGSEFEILKAFDFSRYDVRLITVEHNYRKDRDNIHRLLLSNGFVRKFSAISLVDDWYVNSGVVALRDGR
jgi:FkbM family methyltransferase